MSDGPARREGVCHPGQGAYGATTSEASKLGLSKARGGRTRSPLERPEDYYKRERAPLLAAPTSSQEGHRKQNRRVAPRAPVRPVGDSSPERELDEGRRWLPGLARGPRYVTQPDTSPTRPPRRVAPSAKDDNRVGVKAESPDDARRSSLPVKQEHSPEVDLSISCPTSPATMQRINTNANMGPSLTALAQVSRFEQARAYLSTMEACEPGRTIQFTPEPGGSASPATSRTVGTASSRTHSLHSSHSQLNHPIAAWDESSDSFRRMRAAQHAAMPPPPPPSRSLGSRNEPVPVAARDGQQAATAGTDAESGSVRSSASSFTTSKHAAEISEASEYAGSIE